MNAKHLFLTLVAIFTCVSYMSGEKTTATDVISLSTISAKGYDAGLSEEDVNSVSDWTFTSGATYASNAMFYISEEDTWGLDKDSTFVSTASVSGRKLKSITIDWYESDYNYDPLEGSGDKAKLMVYARNGSAYSPSEKLAGGEKRYTFTYDDGITTYNFDSEYEYVALVASGDYGAFFTSISIEWEWEVYTYYSVSGGVITEGTWGTNVTASPTSAKEGDLVTITFTPKRTGKTPKITKYSLTSYGFDGMEFDLSCSSYITNPNTYEVSFPMPARDVTIDATFEVISFTNANIVVDGSVSIIQSGLDATISFTHLDDSDAPIAGYDASMFSLSSSDASVLYADAVQKVSDGNYTVTVHGLAAGSARLTIDGASIGTIKASTGYIDLVVQPRSIALVAQYGGESYAMKNTLAASMADAVKVYYDAINDVFYYESAVDIDQLTWNAANPAKNKYTIQNPNNSDKYLTYDAGLLSEEIAPYQWIKNAYGKFINSDKWGIVYDGSNFLADNVIEQAAAEALISNFLPLTYSTTAGAGIIDARSLLTDDWGTICVPFNVADATSAATGANFYELTGKHVEGGTLVGIYLSDALTSLEAGHSYLYQMVGTSIELNGSGAYLTEADNSDTKDGFVGCLTADGGGTGKIYIPDGEPNGDNTDKYNGCYGVSKGKLRYVSKGAVGSIKAFRAYIDASELDEPAPVPGRRMIMNVDYQGDFDPENVVTSIIDLDDAAFIDWNQPVYNIMGIQVGQGATGVLIQNGHKFLVQ